MVSVPVTGSLCGTAPSSGTRVERNSPETLELEEKGSKAFHGLTKVIMLMGYTLPFTS